MNKNNINIFVYTFCYNNAFLIPFVIEYWKLYATKVIVYDNGSNDGSINLLKKYDWIEIRHYDTKGIFDQHRILELKNECWKECRNTNVDYVMVCDIDEVLVYGDNLLQWLKDKKMEGISIFNADYYDVINKNKCEYIQGYLVLDYAGNRFIRCNNLKKVCLFSPDIDITFIMNSTDYMLKHKCNCNNISMLHLKLFNVSNLKQTQTLYGSRTPKDVTLPYGNNALSCISIYNYKISDYYRNKYTLSLLVENIQPTHNISEKRKCELKYQNKAIKACDIQWTRTSIQRPAEIKNKQCVVMIPVYKLSLTDNEKRSLKQVVSILGDSYDIVLVGPDSLYYDYYDAIADYQFGRLKCNDEYFRSIDGYSMLCETSLLYLAFSEYDYMFLYQLDGWIFKDNLRKFCIIDYDYIGSPWKDGDFGSTFDCVGNGGVSFRKISTFIKLCNEITKEELNGKYANLEDLFFCKIMAKRCSWFRIAPVETAMMFCLDSSPQYWLSKNGNLIPMCLHAWHTRIPFWGRHIEYSEKVCDTSEEINDMTQQDESREKYIEEITVTEKTGAKSGSEDKPVIEETYISEPNVNKHVNNTQRRQSISDVCNNLLKTILLTKETILSVVDVPNKEGLVLKNKKVETLIKKTLQNDVSDIHSGVNGLKITEVTKEVISEPTANIADDVSVYKPKQHEYTTNVVKDIAENDESVNTDLYKYKNVCDTLNTEFFLHDIETFKGEDNVRRNTNDTAYIHNDIDIKPFKNASLKNIDIQTIKEIQDFTYNDKGFNAVEPTVNKLKETKHDERLERPDIEVNTNEPYGISICISAYKATQYIQQTLDSIVEQSWFKTNDNWEVIIGVDGCIDTMRKCSSLVKRYGKKHFRYYMMSDNKGTYVTSNTIMSIAKYEWLLRFDADDLMVKDAVKVLMDNTKKEYDIYRFKLKNFKDRTCSNQKVISKIICPTYGLILVRKSVFLKFGGYRDWICSGDSEFLTRTRNFTKQHIIDQVLMLRRVSETSLTQSQSTGYQSATRCKYDSFIRDVSAKIRYMKDAVIKFQTNTYTEINDRLAVAICAIGKNENAYVREWVEYHLYKVGIDKIFIYDNNDLDGEHFEDVIGDYVNNGLVEIIDVRGMQKGLVFDDKGLNLLPKCYIDCYKSQGNFYDFISFIDIDEFICFKNGLTLLTFLLHQAFSNYDTICISWEHYDDNGYTRYENRPVMERFTHKSKISAHGLKSFVRTCKEIYTPEGFVLPKMIHYFRLEGLKAIYADGTTILDISSDNWILMSDSQHNRCNVVLNHYKTKSAEEYMQRQVGRVWGTSQSVAKNATSLEECIRDYYRYNEVTPENELFFKKYI